MIWGNLSYIASEIPESTTVGQMCHIDRDVVIGENCKIQGMCYIPPKTVIEDDVFLGPQVAISNDKYPHKSGELQGTTIKKGAVIGLGSRIMGGITIGERAMIGMGSVVTKDVPDGEIWYGNPARYSGVMNVN